MITFQTEGLLKNFPDIDPRTHASQIPHFLESIQKRDQGFWTDDVLLDPHEDMRIWYQQHAEKYTHVVILGIGGSGLGAKALKDSLGDNDRLRILDNIDPENIEKKTRDLNLQKTLFLTISKSGGTPETIAQYLYFREMLAAKNLPIREYFVFIGDAEGSGFLHQEAKKEELQTFSLPKNVGGRFSLFTVVGLLPALFLGIDGEALLRGARMMRDRFLSTDVEENLPFQLASIQYALHQKGYMEHVFYAYQNALYSFLLWERQLLAESIGKQGQGITPIASLGASDQHSQNQLYFDGPQTKGFFFLETRTVKRDLSIPPNDLVGRSFQELLLLEKRGTELALQEAKIPQMTISLQKRDTETMGALFFLFQGATAFLGEYFGINAFDQPAVELSKSITRALLASEKRIPPPKELHQEAEVPGLQL